ncbi:MAG: signal peptidase II [Clostridiaceae bacterium]|jgi:signal peptidase II|nr:signal peptidase II [Clostridiaceae bacterium]
MLTFFIVCAIVCLDQLVKFWTIQNLMGGDPIVLIPGVFQLTYVENRGAAFSFLENQIWFFVLTTVCVLAAIAYALYKKVILTKLGKWSLIFVAGGAIGNLIDRILHGYVVDMFYFELIDFPVFNVADIFIVIGGILFAYYIVIQYDRAKKNLGE